jgi:hypothetical protein
MNAVASAKAIAAYAQSVGMSTRAVARLRKRAAAMSWQGVEDYISQERLAMLFELKSRDEVAEIIQTALETMAKAAGLKSLPSQA